MIFVLCQDDLSPSDAESIEPADNDPGEAGVPPITPDSPSDTGAAGVSTLTYARCSFSTHRCRHAVSCRWYLSGKSAAGCRYR